MTEVNEGENKANNDKFSPCSIDSISKVLYYVLRKPPRSKQTESFLTNMLPSSTLNCFEGNGVPISKLSPVNA